MDDLKKGLIFEGLASAELKDQTNEVMSLEGMDITDLENGTGYLNWDHSNAPQDIIGKVISAKKIFNDKDCETPNQKKFWDQVKEPFLWIKGEIFTEGGPNEFEKAKQVAALMKRFSQYGLSPIRLSVEGKVLQRDGKDDKVLARTSVSRVAVTARPCLKETRTEIVGESSVQKAIHDLGLDTLSKNELGSIPDPTPISIEMNPTEKALAALNSLKKALSVGYGQALAPQARTGAAAMTKESFIVKARPIKLKVKKKKKPQTT
jgi:hypothetical protein